MALYASYQPEQTEVSLMKSCFDENLLWWKPALMKSCFDEKLLWWKAALMKSCFDEKPLRWKATLMKSCFDEKPLWWKAALMKSRFDEKLPHHQNRLKSKTSFHLIMTVVAQDVEVWQCVVQQNSTLCHDLKCEDVDEWSIMSLCSANINI